MNKVLYEMLYITAQVKRVSCYTALMNLRKKPPLYFLI